MGRGFTKVTATALTLGFAFLYLPIVLLVIFSFNASKLVTVWGGFSPNGTAMLFHSDQLDSAAWVTCAWRPVRHSGAILGTLAAVALTRTAASAAARFSPA